MTDVCWYTSRLLTASAWVALFSSAVVCTTTSATTIRPLSLEKLTQASSEVVQGTIIGLEGVWNANRTAIYTRMTLSPERTLRGSLPGGEVTVLLAGGTVGGTTSILVDAPRLEQGDEVVMFLNRVAGDFRQEVDLPASVSPFQLADPLQGVFEVVTDAATGERRAVSHAATLMASDPAALAQPELRAEFFSLGGPKGLPLDELAARVGQSR